MSTFSQFISSAGLLSTPTIAGYPTVSNPSDEVALYSNSSIASILSGSLTAATYKTMVDITSGSGFVSFAVAKTLDNTARDIAVRVTLDGNVFERTLTGSSVANRAVNAVGLIDGSGAPILEPVWFSTSMKIEIRSSLSETDNLEVVYRYWRIT